MEIPSLYKLGNFGLFAWTSAAKVIPIYLVWVFKLFYCTSFLTKKKKKKQARKSSEWQFTGNNTFCVPELRPDQTGVDWSTEKVSQII